MDMGFGPPAPETFGEDFLGLAENNIDRQYPEQLCGMLESLENSIEQSLPPAGILDVPSDTMLDLVEHSAEGQVVPGMQLPEYLQDHHLWGLMDALESATENQAIKKEKPVEAPAPDPEEVYGSFSQAVVPHLGGTGFIRERSCHEYKMTGSRTGIRCSQSGMEYCYLRQTWIQPNVCDSCGDFEPEENVIAESDELYCRYKF